MYKLLDISTIRFYRHASILFIFGCASESDNFTQHEAEQRALRRGEVGEERCQTLQYLKIADLVLHARRYHGI